MSGQVLRWLTWSGYVLIAPVLAVSVSGIYFFTSPGEQRLRTRILASAHGAAIALLYLTAWVVLLTHGATLRLGSFFALGMFVPLSLMILSFFLYRGRMVMHWLQIINAACLLWVGFAGIMLITGESL